MLCPRVRWIALLLPLVAVLMAAAPLSPAGASTAPPPTSRPAATTTASQASAADVAATQPAATPAEEEVVPRELKDLDLVKVLRGQKHLTPEQIFQLGYWVDFVKDFVFGVLKFIPRLFAAVFLFGLFWLIYRGTRSLITGGMARAGVDSSIREMLSSLLKWGILGFGLVIAGNQVGIQIAALLTGVSIIGLSVGFAAQTTLANFIAGVVIFWDKPFKIGDWVEIDGVFARVIRVTFRSTRLLNQEGEVVVFANTAMLNTRLLNHTTEPLNRISVPVRIGWNESIDENRAMLLGLLRGDQRVCRTPAAGVVVESLGVDCVNLVLHFWVADESLVFDIRYEYLEKAKRALDAAAEQRNRGQSPSALLIRPEPDAPLSKAG